MTMQQVEESVEPVLLHKQEDRPPSLESLLSRQRQPIYGKIQYNWRKAQEDIIAKAKLQRQSFPSQQSQLIAKIASFLQICSQKLIPDFYCHSTLAAVIQTSSPQEALTQETTKIRKGQCEYQEIALQLTLQESLLTKIVQKQRDKEDCFELIDQLRQVHILSIHKINTWQQKMSKLLKYPAIFYWGGYNYLIQLNQSKNISKEGESGLRTHIQIHELFLNTRGKEQVLESKSLSIVKMAKSRQLELILNLPFYAHLKSAAPSRPKQDKGGYLKNSNVFISKSSKSLALNKRFSVQDLGADEVAVIKRFRSYKKLNIAPRRRTQSQKEAVIGPVNDKLRDKLALLKQKVKDHSQHSKDKIQFEKRRPSDKSIRLICQKEVDLSDENSPTKKQAILNALSLAPASNQVSLTTASRVSTDRISRLRTQMAKLTEINLKKKVQMESRSKNLQNLKQQLTEKVRKGYATPHKRTATLPDRKKSEIIQSKIQPKVIKQVEDPKISKYHKLKQQLQKERVSMQRQQKALNQAKSENNNLSAKMRDQFTGLNSEKQKYQELLRQKKEKVSRLNEKIKTENIFERSEPQDSLQLQYKQLQKLKKKKQLEYEYQKQKINEVGSTLEQRVKQERIKYEQLKQNEEKKEKDLKQKLELQVEAIKKAMEQESLLIKSQIEEEEKKRKAYEQKIEKQKLQNEKMMEQLRAWSQKQEQLLLMLEQQNQKRALKEQEARLRRKAMMQAQLLEMQRKQQQIVKGYRSANINLLSMLDTLKHKNYELQQKMGSNQ